MLSGSCLRGPPAANRNKRRRAVMVQNRPGTTTLAKTLFFLLLAIALSALLLAFLLQSCCLVRFTTDSGPFLLNLNTLMPLAAFGLDGFYYSAYSANSAPGFLSGM